MNSYKITKFDKEKNHLTVEFTIGGEKKEIRFDANHLPTGDENDPEQPITPEEALDEYLVEWIKAYESGKKTEPANDYAKFVGKSKTVG